jgi:hypothetical protein
MASIFFVPSPYFVEESISGRLPQIDAPRKLFSNNSFPLAKQPAGLDIDKRYLFSVAILLSDCQVKQWQLTHEQLQTHVNNSSRLLAFWELLIGQEDLHLDGIRDAISRFAAIYHLSFRDGPSWIGTNRIIHPDSFIFCDPSGIELGISALQDFDRLEDNPFVRAVVTFVFVVMLHPLDDGNGRLARYLSFVTLFRDIKDYNYCAVVVRLIATRLFAPQREVQGERLELSGHIQSIIKAVSDDKFDQYLCGVNRARSLDFSHNTANKFEKDLRRNGCISVETIERSGLNARSVSNLINKVISAPVRLAGKAFEVSPVLSNELEPLLG